MKRSSLLFRTCIGWFLFGVLFLQSSYAQDSNNTNSIAMHAVLSDGYFKPQSPDVWSMIKYGNANIDYYTGTLGISIPIYTYKDNNFEIPISIDYASSGFQPGSPSGLVGQGWYLNFGGAITREVRGIPDDAIQEMYDWREKADQEMNEIPWWDEYTFPDQGSYIYGHSVRIDGYAQSYFKTTPTDSLNIVYTGAAGQEYMPYWKDETNSRLGFETEPDVFNFKVLNYSGSFILQPNHQIKVFNTNQPAGEFHVEFLMENYAPLSTSKFIITTGDKTKYYFEHIESCRTVSDLLGGGDNPHRNYTWKLTRIEAPNGNNVRFFYNKVKYNTYETITPVVTIDYLSDRNPDNDPTPVYTVSNFVNEYLLDSIVVENKARIEFAYSSGNLTSINVFNDRDRNPVKSCALEYFLNDKGSGYVTFLKKVALSGEGQYTMDYYDETSEFAYNHTFKVDQHGYYNGQDAYSKPPFPADLKKLAEKLRTWRDPNETCTRMGMLKTIHYPTGGYSNFSYEQNEAFYLGQNIKVGGLRVKQIDVFSQDGNQTQNRIFKYTQKENANRSSGAMIHIPCYYWQYSIIAAGASFNREIVSSLNNVGFAKDSYFEYLRVIEEVRKKSTDSSPLSITEYEFYSANADNNGGTPKEIYEQTENLRASDGWTVEVTLYPSAEFNTSMLHTSTLRGGKLRMKTEYAGDMDHPVKREEYVYSESDNDEIGVNTVFMCMAANHIYNPNSIVLQQKIEEVYNKDAELIYRNEDNYSVNDLGRVNSVIRTDSKGDEIREMYSYLDRVPAYPTEIIKTNKGNVISAMKIDYEQQSNAEDHYTPSKVWKGALGVTPPNIEYRMDCKYDFYDSMGRPWEMTDRNGKSTCYIWGYEGQYLVAKIENMTYDVLSDQYGITNNAYPDTLPETEENMLRGIEGIAVTTYAYDPLVGITRITDPSGHSVYYEYNDSGKLKVIRDDKGKVLKSYDYHIVTDNQ